MTVKAATATVTASVLAAFAPAALPLTAPRLPLLEVKPSFRGELHDPEALVPPPARRVGGVVAGAAPPRSFVAQSSEEELPQAGVTGHVAHHLTEHRRTAARQA